MAERMSVASSDLTVRGARRPRPLHYRLLRLLLPVTRPFAHASQARKRHRFYLQLLLSFHSDLLWCQQPPQMRLPPPRAAAGAWRIYQHAIEQITACAGSVRRPVILQRGDPAF